MATCYLEAVRHVQPTGPYLLGGYSMGGLVAFEMARQLQKQDEQVALLALLDPSLPLSAPEDFEMDDVELLVGIAQVIERFLGKELAVSCTELRELGSDEQLNYLLERLKRIKFVPATAGVSVIRGLLQVARANGRATMSYVPQVYAGRTTLFRTNPVSAAEYRGELAELLRDPAHGWAALSLEPIELHTVPGEHITLLTEPHVRVLAEHLVACLGKLEEEPVA
jgi:thioesterase domain-containing protein